MRIMDGEALGALLDDRALIEALRAMFVAGCKVPARHQHTVAQPNAQAGAAATLLLMPASKSATTAAVAGHAGDAATANTGSAVEPVGAFGVKIITVYSGNGSKGLPVVVGNYMLLDGATGLARALINGQALTARGIAATSAIAAHYLARGDARVMTVVGTGALAPHLVRAHATVRPIEGVWIWGWSQDKARAFAETLKGELGGSLGGKQIIVQATDSLERASRSADVIFRAAPSSAPLVAGDRLELGQHRDLTGDFTPAKRETDDAAIASARVYVDTRARARLAA